MINEQRPEFYEYINQKLDTNFNSSYCYVFGKYTEEGEIMGVLCLHTIVEDEGRADLSIVTDGGCKWFTRHEYIQWLDLVFNKMNFNRLQTYTPVENEKALQLARKIGLTQEARLRDWYGVGKDAILSYLLKRHIFM